MLFVVIIGYITIIKKTNESIIQGVNENSSVDYYTQHKKRVPYIVIMMGITFGLGMYNKYLIHHTILLMTMMFTFTFIYNESRITDPKTKRINRFVLRWGYFWNLVIALYLTYFMFPDLFSKYASDLILVLVALVIMFFANTGLGASDFRCLFLVIPAYQFFLGNKVAGIPFLISCAYAVWFQRREQKRIGEKVPVPVGDIFMFPAPLVAILGIAIKFILRYYI